MLLSNVLLSNVLFDTNSHFSMQAIHFIINESNKKKRKTPL